MRRPGKWSIEPFRQRLEIRHGHVVFQIRRTRIAKRQRAERRCPEIWARSRQLLDVDDAIRRMSRSPAPSRPPGRRRSTPSRSSCRWLRAARPAAFGTASATLISADPFSIVSASSASSVKSVPGRCSNGPANVARSRGSPSGNRPPHWESARPPASSRRATRWCAGSSSVVRPLPSNVKRPGQ